MIERHGLGVEVLEELATIFHISGDEAKVLVWYNLSAVRFVWF